MQVNNTTSNKWTASGATCFYELTILSTNACSVWMSENY